MESIQKSWKWIIAWKESLIYFYRRGGALDHLVTVDQYRNYQHWFSMTFLFSRVAHGEQTSLIRGYRSIRAKNAFVAFDSLSIVIHPPLGCVMDTRRQEEDGYFLVSVLGTVSIRHTMNPPRQWSRVKKLRNDQVKRVPVRAAIKKKSWLES